jgi:hypothetical protein
VDFVLYLTRTYARFPDGARLYDMQYRKQVAKARLAGFRWSWARDEHLVNAIFLSRPVTTCVCGSSEHGTADHPTGASAATGSREMVTGSRETDPGQTKKAKVCFKFNRKGCSDSGCRFKHVCSRCEGEHRVADCKKSGKD